MVLWKLLGEPEFPRTSRFEGFLYPGDPPQLRELVRRNLTAPSRTACAVVVPHDDMRLVAPVVGSGIGALRPASRVVVIGPSLKIPFRGLAVPNADGWTTPLGTLRIDTKCYEKLGSLGTVRDLDAAFDPEPAIEMILPWLCETHPKAKLVPLLCGDVDTEDVGAVLDALATDETVFVVASNLAADGRAPSIARRDEITLSAIERLAGDDIARGDATARRAIGALTRLALRRGWHARRLSHRTSAELGAEGDLVAGFAAVGFFEGAS